jgi:hypothetical protein
LTAKKFILQAKSQTGELTQIEIALSILPTYVIQVIDGDDQTNPATSFDFDSQKDIAYFRPHAEGLQLIFLNKSTKSFVIHGEGLIKHQDTHVPTSPGQEYLPPKIFPASGADVPSYYTIHAVYHPDRHVIFNATKVPDVAH